MPDLTLSIGIDWKSSGREPFALARVKGLLESGTNRIDYVRNIGTSYETVDLGDVAAGGYVYLENLDDTNFMQVRQGAETAVIRLEPGDFALFRLDDSATIQAQADTAECEMRAAGFDP